MFTRRGDQGETDTGSRKRVAKSSSLINLEGTIDETISFIGFATVKTRWEDIRQDLRTVQEDLFTIGEEITSEGAGRHIDRSRVDWLEERTLEYRKEIGRIDLFVVPDGSEEATSLHICRTVVRRLERLAVSLRTELGFEGTILAYLNRLSSLLFMMALASNRRLGITERIWRFRKEGD
ncbi:cob(I)yrinic acid a,c-diamide adenosyltransferase [Thermogymnomonas acidicola]|uniref:cob(I)yrinic acid a,c-diamide adenosyltransferase n=1 Tax=Thermogymnomonas acidicola TaxID=399579 RepID=UPI001662E8B6|nr:cob(I)yrinic acid a,c-diamide adenosyltransferase [Thermogymnomonas acidicola]